MSIVLFEQAVIVLNTFPVEIHNLEVINKPETMRELSGSYPPSFAGLLGGGGGNFADSGVPVPLPASTCNHSLNSSLSSCTGTTSTWFSNDSRCTYTLCQLRNHEPQSSTFDAFKKQHWWISLVLARTAVDQT